MSTSAIESGTEFPLLHDSDVAARHGFLTVIERGDTGWGAYVPDLPGVAAAAGSEEEVRVLIAEAIEFHLEGLRMANEPVPEPASQAWWVPG